MSKWNQLLMLQVEKFKRDRRHIACACFAAIFGVTGALVGESWWLSAKPNLIEIRDLSVVLADGATDHYWLEVTLHGPPATNCVRQSQHLLFSDANKLRTFIPLGSALNGMSYSSPATDLKVTLDIPPGTHGEWIYIDRSMYTCIIWPGLVKLYQSETPHMRITIPMNR